MYQFASRWVSLVALLIVAAASANPQSRNISIHLNLNSTAGPLEMDRFALGQGGLSEEPMWADRVAEIRDLHPRLIRLFIQEYFDLLPERGRYHFQKLDESVDLILKTGAKPINFVGKWATSAWLISKRQMEFATPFSVPVYTAAAT